MEDVYQLFTKLFSDLSALKTRRLVAVARVADFPSEIPALAMQHIDPSANVPPRHIKAFSYREKQIAIHCAQATMVPLAKYPGLNKVRFWADPDSTTIEWFSGRRAVKGEIGNFFVDVEPGQEPQKVNVMRITNPKPKLLEVADAIAYLSQRGRSSAGRSSDTDRIKELVRFIGAEQIRMGIAPDGGLGFQIPNATLEYRPT
jgi:hypothetical protein